MVYSIAKDTAAKHHQLLTTNENLSKELHRSLLHVHHKTRRKVRHLDCLDDRKVLLAAVRVLHQQGKAQLAQEVWTSTINPKRVLLPGEN